MIVGMPNVGKSSLLNSLRREGVGRGKVAHTGAQPGVTRKIGTGVKIIDASSEEEGGSAPVYLLDTPGVFIPYVPDADAMLKLALCGSVKDTVIPPFTLADYLLYHVNLVNAALYEQYHAPTNDEFLDPIPRKEVEDIAAVVHRHAVKVRDEGIQSLIVGGYRRGKEKCGDVDMIVSHPDESQTLNIINDIVASLEDEGWITHTLLLSLHSTHRGQQTLPFKASHNNPVHLGGGGGFDTLDKALVVWQDPHRATETEDLAANPKAKNPNIHRRVDIIIAPWRTVGCAVAGWSGGTTFQRDLRRYCKNVKGLKFDSSGVRDRGNGEVVDVEGWREYKGSIGEGKAGDMVQAERRVFEGLGLAFREPWERCTG